MIPFLSTDWHTAFDGWDKYQKEYVKSILEEQINNECVLTRRRR